MAVSPYDVRSSGNAMNPFYKIAIDCVNANYLSGWCFLRKRPEEPVHLQWRLGDMILAETIADRMREDLRELNIHPTGRCGFELFFQPQANASSTEVIDLVVPGTRIPLLRLSADTLEPIGIRRLYDKFGTMHSFRRRQRNILFMHIPKTAGTSFNTMASQLLSRDGARSHIELVNPSRYMQFQGRYRYVSGHLPIGVWKSCFDLDRADLFTIVREPFSQLHSHLKWLIATSTVGRDQFFKLQNRVIYDLGRRLAGLDFSTPEVLAAFVSGLDDLEAAFLDNLQTRYFLDELPLRIYSGDLQRALDNCQLFRMIGVTEDYSSFVEAFLRLYRLKHGSCQARLNRSSSPPLYDYLDPDNCTAVLPLVRFDLALYERACLLGIT